MLPLLDVRVAGKDLATTSGVTAAPSSVGSRVGVQRVEFSSAHDCAYLRLRQPRGDGLPLAATRRAWPLSLCHVPQPWTHARPARNMDRRPRFRAGPWIRHARGQSGRLERGPSAFLGPDSVPLGDPAARPARPVAAAHPAQPWSEFLTARGVHASPGLVDTRVRLERGEPGFGHDPDSIRSESRTTRRSAPHGCAGPAGTSPTTHVRQGRRDLLAAG